MTRRESAGARQSVFFQTVPLTTAALDAFFERVGSTFLIGGTGYGGVRSVERGGEFVLAAPADSATERERLAQWLRAQPEIGEAYPIPAIGRVWP